MNIDVGIAVWAVLATAVFLRMVVAEPSFTTARKRGCVLGVVVMFASFCHPATYGIGILLSIFLSVIFVHLTTLGERPIHDELIREFEKNALENAGIASRNPTL